MDGSTESAYRDEQFTFTGNASEYFRIWIVNLFLTIITLGIYSPWAKVRRLKYFYGNTWLDGHNFDYIANPVSILKGRLIVVAVLIVYNVLISISPVFFVLAVVYLALLPWIINKSLAFNARMTVYRNVRFGFGGSLGKAFQAFVLWPIASTLTGTILAPFSSQATSNYIGSNSRYGAAKFSTNTQLGPFYGNYGRTLLYFVLPVFVVGAVAAGVAFSGAEEPLVVLQIAFVGLYLFVFLGYFYYAAGVRNIAFNSSSLEGGHELISSVGRGRYVWIMVTNFLATICTLGLLRPWAAIRTWSYIAASTTLIVNGSLDAIIDEAQAEGSVTTAEFLDIEGIDFGL